MTCADSSPIGSMTVACRPTCCVTDFANSISRAEFLAFAGWSFGSVITNTACLRPTIAVMKVRRNPTRLPISCSVSLSMYKTSSSNRMRQRLVGPACSPQWLRPVTRLRCWPEPNAFRPLAPPNWNARLRGEAARFLVAVACEDRISGSLRVDADHADRSGAASGRQEVGALCRVGDRLGKVPKRHQRMGLAAAETGGQDATPHLLQRLKPGGRKRRGTASTGPWWGGCFGRTVRASDKCPALRHARACRSWRAKIASSSSPWRTSPLGLQPSFTPI